MTMDNPEIGKTYVFVRRIDGHIEHTEFSRHADGSAGFLADQMYHVYENDPDSWKDALAHLERLGFVEAREAKTRGIVPQAWEPTAESSAIMACRGPIDIS